MRHLSYVFLFTCLTFHYQASFSQENDTIIFNEYDVDFFGERIKCDGILDSKNPIRELGYFSQTNIELSENWVKNDTICLRAFGTAQKINGMPVFHFSAPNLITGYGEIQFCKFHVFPEADGEYGQDMESCLFAKYYFKDDLFVIKNDKSNLLDEKNYYFKIEWLGDYCCRLIKM